MFSCDLTNIISHGVIIKILVELQPTTNLILQGKIKIIDTSHFLPLQPLHRFLAMLHITSVSRSVGRVSFSDCVALRLASLLNQIGTLEDDLSRIRQGEKFQRSNKFWGKILNIEYFKKILFSVQKSYC